MVLRGVIEQIFFRRVPDVLVDISTEIEVAADNKAEQEFKRRPKWITLLVLLITILSFINYLNTKKNSKNNEIEAEQTQKQQKEFALQNLINKLYTNGQLSETEQAELCDLLWELEGISIPDCESISANELLKLLNVHPVDYKASVGESSTLDYRKTFFNAHPELEGKVIVHHAIEQSVQNRYPDLFTKSQIHSLENLRGISKDINSNLHLSKIRKEWYRFYNENPNPTIEEILKKVTEIDKEYGYLFKPPLLP